MNNDVISLIAKEYGTPFYVLDIEKFKNNYAELQNAYRRRYNPFQIAYSFKTNYMPIICKTILNMGGWAEVVSDMEYQMALKFGFLPQNIIVNGPGKWYGLEKMASDGAIIMLDNVHEFKKLLEIAESRSIVVRIGFRLNLDIGTGKKSRFGFDISDKNTEIVIKQAFESPLLSVEGVHFHLGGARGLDAWRNRADEMIKCVDCYFSDGNIKIIDLGSGMFGHLKDDLAKQFGQYIPSFEEYAEVVASKFEKKYGNKPAEMRPTLIVEPGATIVANTMQYVTRVIATKNIRERRIAIVDGSVQQLGELGKKKQLPASVIVSSSSDSVDVLVTDVTGYTCLEDDILYRSFKGRLDLGDLVSFENAGAYTNVMKPPFIQVGCKVIAFDKGELSLVKRQETVEDILSSYVV